MQHCVQGAAAAAAGVMSRRAVEGA